MVPLPGTSWIFQAERLWGEWVWCSVERQEKLRHWLTQFPHPKKWVAWVGYPLGFSRALTSSLALFLQVVIRLLSSSSPQRVRWTVNVLTHVVQGEQASGDSNPDPGKPMCLQCALVSPSVQWGQYCSGSCSQPLRSEGSSTNWLCGLGQITEALWAQRSC